MATKCKQRQNHFIALEPRMMFDGAAVATAVSAVAGAASNADDMPMDGSFWNSQTPFNSVSIGLAEVGINSISAAPVQDNTAAANVSSLVALSYEPADSSSRSSATPTSGEISEAAGFKGSSAISATFLSGSDQSEMSGSNDAPSASGTADTDATDLTILQPLAINGLQSSNLQDVIDTQFVSNERMPDAGQWGDDRSFTASRAFANQAMSLAGFDAYQFNRSTTSEVPVGDLYFDQSTSTDATTISQSFAITDDIMAQALTNVQNIDIDDLYAADGTANVPNDYIFIDSNVENYQDLVAEWTGKGTMVVSGCSAGWGRSDISSLGRRAGFGSDPSRQSRR